MAGLGSWGLMASCPFVRSPADLFPGVDCEESLARGTITDAHVAVATVRALPAMKGGLASSVDGS